MLYLNSIPVIGYTSIYANKSVLFFAYLVFVINFYCEKQQKSLLFYSRDQKRNSSLNEFSYK